MYCNSAQAIKRYNVFNYEEIKEIPLNSNFTCSFGYSKKLNLVAVGNCDQDPYNIYLYDVIKGKLCAELKGHSNKLFGYPFIFLED